MPGPRIEVHPIAPDQLAEPLALLEELLRHGRPLPSPFAERLGKAVERGDVEVLAARTQPGANLVGVAMLAYAFSVSSAGLYASIEELYVAPRARRQGVGRALLEAVRERCTKRGVSYVEVQTDDEAVAFYEASGYESELGVRLLSRSYPL